jgi:hypothetical protein
MLRNSARMLILAVIVLLAGVVGCASTGSSGSPRDSSYASGAESGAGHGSCH